MASVADFSRQIGQILGSFPYTMAERGLILEAMGEADAIEDMPPAVQSLLSRALANRINTHHDPHSGKFASHGGSAAPKAGGARLRQDQYDAIQPGKGNTKASATKKLKETAEGEALIEVTHEWQDNMTSVTRLQKNFVKRANNGKLTKKEDAKVTALMDGIARSPVSPPLHRGVRMKKGFNPETELAPGKTFILPPSSFTTSSRQGRGFAQSITGREETVPVVYRVNAARGLPVEVFGLSQYKHEKEYISAGQYKVTGVTRGKDGVYTVDVEHTAMFTW